MIDILIGATWTLLCVLVGALITFVLLAVVSDRGDDPGDPGDPGDEWPEPDPGLDFQLFEAQLLSDEDRARITQGIIDRWEEDLAEMEREGLT